MLTSLEIERLLRGYGLAAAPELTDKVGAYIELLLKWNRKIALTTVTDPEEIVRFHFGESLFATSRYNLENSRLADVGTGGGFPGLPLALAIPTLSVTLIESNLKKCAFLAEILRELGVRNAAIFSGRMEFFAPGPVPFDFITARAFGKAAHAGNNHKEGVNALWAIARFTDRLQVLTNYDRGVTVNVGKIAGGQGKNTVPHEAEAAIDIRFCTRNCKAL